MRFWLPRILAIGYIMFLAFFALDVFAPGKPLLDMLRAFLIHLIPNFILLGILIVAWKKEKIGGILFMLVAILMFYTFKNSFMTNIFLFAPLFLIGCLFLVQDSNLFWKDKN